MINSVFFPVIVCIWAALYVLDFILLSHGSISQRYISFLSRSGIALSLGQLRWYTVKFNRFFIRISQISTNFYKIWFTIGAMVGLVAMVGSMCLFIITLVNTIKRIPAEQQALTPVIPGVNLPYNQIPYYLLTLLICGILHEMGHAIAATVEQVRVNGFGIFLLIIYPGAFVDVSTEHIQLISPLRQLRVYAAGVWHNFVIVFMSFLVLQFFPYFITPLYRSGQGVLVLNVLENSVVSGTHGFMSGSDVIKRVGDCPVFDAKTFSKCVLNSIKRPPLGYCILVDQLRSHRASGFLTPSGDVECCNASQQVSHLCFRYFPKQVNVEKILSSNSTSLVQRSSNAHVQSLNQYACLPARLTTDGATCRHSHGLDCRGKLQALRLEITCVYPSLGNSSRFLRVARKGKPPLLFVGHPYELLNSVIVSNYIPVYNFLMASLPNIVETLCRYLISLSGALALMNVVPCYALDGQWILRATLDLLLPMSIVSLKTKSYVFTVFLSFGTVLLVTNLLVAVLFFFYDL